MDAKVTGDATEICAGVYAALKGLAFIALNEWAERHHDAGRGIPTVDQAVARTTMLFGLFLSVMPAGNTFRVEMERYVADGLRAEIELQYASAKGGGPPPLRLV